MDKKAKDLSKAGSKIRKPSLIAAIAVASAFALAVSLLQLNNMFHWFEIRPF